MKPSYFLLVIILFTLSCKKERPVVSDQWNGQLLDKSWMVLSHHYKGVLNNNAVGENFEFRSDGNLYFTSPINSYRDTIPFKVVDHHHLSFAIPWLTNETKGMLVIDRLTPQEFEFTITRVAFGDMDNYKTMAR